MKKLTARQKEVLDFITSFVDDHAYPPTIREMGDRFSMSIKGAYDHVKALEKKGFLKLAENRSRAIELLNRDKPELSVVELPLLGTVAAGRPITADENYAGSVHVPADMVRAATCFALSVRGDSMKGVGIFHGDLAVIEQRQTADNGEIVVAMIDDAVTLKRFFRENNRVKLMAENSAYAPIYTQDVKILGRLRGIIRKY
jgi:repressor LexA